MRIIAGKWKGRRLVPVRGRRIRPTTDRVREAWMSILMPRLDGARVLDLFSGSGALGLEALSRGAVHVTFIEKGRGAVRVLERNVRQVGADDLVRVIHGDAMTSRPDADFDIALADPPYEKGLAQALIEQFAAAPFATEPWVEHRVDEVDPKALPTELRLDQRRYGDTMLTGVSLT